MRLVFFLVFLFVANTVVAQSNHVNKQSGYGAAGYDLISYFDSDPIKGKEKYTVVFENITYKFSSSEHAKQFKESPTKYLPQYGGWCAYAMASEGEKVKVNPKTFELRDGKLYLFYNAYFSNTFEDWLEEGPEQLILKADKNWQGIVK